MSIAPSLKNAPILSAAASIGYCAGGWVIVCTIATKHLQNPKLSQTQ